MANYSQELGAAIQIYIIFGTYSHISAKMVLFSQKYWTEFN